MTQKQWNTVIHPLPTGCDQFGNVGDHIILSKSYRLKLTFYITTSH